MLSLKIEEMFRLENMSNMTVTDRTSPANGHMVDGPTANSPARNQYVGVISLLKQAVN